MDRAQAFFLGFGILVVVSWLSSLLVKSWKEMTKSYDQIFSKVPQPKLKENEVITDITQSPVQVLGSGCVNMIIHLLIQLILIVTIGAVFWFGVPQSLPPAFMVGVFLAAIIGFLWQQITMNWKKMSNLRKLIFNSPGLALKKAENPSSHYIAARPVRTPFDIVINGSIEYVSRFLLQLALFYLLYLSISAGYSYISDGVIRFSSTGVFGT